MDKNLSYAVMNYGTIMKLTRTRKPAMPRAMAIFPCHQVAPDKTTTHTKPAPTPALTCHSRLLPALELFQVVSDQATANRV